MHHDETGTGTPLLLIHGFPHDRTLWAPQLAGLADTARVIAPDLRGFDAWADLPDRQAGDRPVLTMEDHARDLRDLLDALHIEQAVIAGLSMGGYVALAFLAAFPKRTRGLVLCSTRAGADTDDGRKGRQAMADRVLREGTAGLAEELAPKMLSAATRAARPRLIAEVRTMIARQRPAAVAAAALGMAQRLDRRPMLPGIRVPTLVLTGDADEMIPDTESRAMAAAVPGSRLVVVPDAGHLVGLEAPEAFDRAVRSFLEQV